MFGSRARAYQSAASFRYSTLWLAPGVIFKYYTELERTARYKQSSLFQKFVTAVKSFTTLTSEMSEIVIIEQMNGKEQVSML
jgi:hypothetical protein